MRFRLAIVLFAAVALCGSASYAAIGWANYQWPCMGASYADNQSIDIYTQAWKGGCTDVGGPCADLSVTIYYRRASEAPNWTSAAMTYLGDVGSNDEYTFQIPAASTTAGDPEEYYIVWHDASDSSDYNPSDHCGGGNVPPMVLNITPATSRPVTVHFSVDMNCLSPDQYSAGVFFAGDFQGWNACISLMTDGNNDGIYEGTNFFPPGSNPYHEYKHNRSGVDGCQWESSISNRTFVIDESGSDMYLPTVKWDNWNCCVTGGPEFINVPGSYCLSLCPCDQMLRIPIEAPLGAPYPVLDGVRFVPGCLTANCNTECQAGAGEPTWDVVPGDPYGWVMVVCLPPTGNTLPGCFCLTIDRILPVELGSFDATAGDGQIVLNWNTRSENDNASFAIERDGSPVAQVPSLGNSASGHRYTWTDRDLENGRTYSYKLFAVDVNSGRSELATVESTPRKGLGTASEYRLEQNYPNPFNPSTSISYSISEAGFVTLSVFNLSGREVATLVNGEMAAGSYSADFNGNILPSGIYYYRLTANDFTATHKMVLMK